MKSRTSRVFSGVISLIAFGGALVSLPNVALAACNGAGWLCFYDYEASAWGSVNGDNPNWGSFGWNDRADYFINYGRSCSVRVYQHAGGGSPGYRIPRGGTLSWPNVVSSNYWC